MIMFNLQVFFYSVFLICSAAKAAKIHKLPDEFLRCNVSAPDYEVCIKRVTERAFSILTTKGIPSLGVLPLDPLSITEIAMQQGAGSSQFTLSLKDVLMYGIKNVSIMSTSNEIPNGRLNMRAEVFVPNFQIISDYKIGGRILILPITGDGKSNFTLLNTKIDAILENVKKEKNGEEYIEVKKFICKVKPGKILVKLDNLFNGNVELGRQMNVFMNENSADIFQDIGPALEEAFGEAFKQICNRIFSKVPYKTIFLH